MWNGYYDLLLLLLTYFGSWDDMAHIARPNVLVIMYIFFTFLIVIVGFCAGSLTQFVKNTYKYLYLQIILLKTNIYLMIYIL
jgi:hypothetical protein